MKNTLVWRDLTIFITVPFVMLCHWRWTFMKPYLHRDGWRGQEDVTPQWVC